MRNTPEAQQGTPVPTFSTGNLYTPGGVRKNELYLVGQDGNNWLLEHPPERANAMNDDFYMAAKTYYDNLVRRL